MKKAAIIGAGPSGLVAACVLATKGYNVTVFEKNSHLGGRLRAENWGGHLVETGPSWLHNSAHPISAALATGGSYQEFNRKVAKSGYIAAYVNYYRKPLALKLINQIYSILIRHKVDTLNLSWVQLIEQILTTDLAKTPEYLTEIKAALNCFPYNWYLDLANPTATRQIFQEFLIDHEIDIHNHSVISGQYYPGAGDTNFLPTGGCSQIIKHLQQEIKANRNITIRTNTAVTAVIAQQVHLNNGEEFACDLIVFAIAKPEYAGITRDRSEVYRTEAALSHLHPSGQAKIAIHLNHNVFLNYYRHIEDPDLGSILFATQGTKPNSSPILYTLVSSNKVEKLFALNSATPLFITKIKTLFPNIPDLAIEKIQVFHATGNSWHTHNRGFQRVHNSGNNIIYLGTVTGCDDSLHAVCTGACIELGVNPDQYLSKLFAPQGKFGKYSKPLLFGAAGMTVAAALHYSFRSGHDNPTNIPPRTMISRY